ncbi:MAG TPA: Uma2 family endonuclease [Roseiflexaceae bacterium]|nr:Uma2 family endonuclease [Roseiflexaceae bacterium]
MIAQPKPYISESEYLELERGSASKHEYFAGEIFAMTGASEQHNLIASNVMAMLHGQLRGRSCRIYPSDMRLKVVQTGLNTYPGITVVCGPPEFTDPTKRDTLINPTIVIEILSPSTERYDRGLKFQNYRSIASLQEYILIAQDQQRIECYARHADNEWLLTEAVGADTSLQIASLSVVLDLNEAYEQVELPASPYSSVPHDVPSE